MCEDNVIGIAGSIMSMYTVSVVLFAHYFNKCWNRKIVHNHDGGTNRDGHKCNIVHAHMIL